MKKVTKLIVMGVALIMCLGLFTGCTADIDGKHKGLSIGFNFTGPRYSQVMSAIKSDKTEFNVDDVTLNFFCGWFGELPYSFSDETVSVAFYITTDQVGQWIDPQGDYLNVENQYFVTEIFAEEFWSESFTASQTRRKGKIFNHKGESVKIPPKAFNQQEGRLELYAQVISYSRNDDLYYFDSSQSGSWYTIYIHYNLIDDNIVKLYRR